MVIRITHKRIPIIVWCLYVVLIRIDPIRSAHIKRHSFVALVRRRHVSNDATIPFTRIAECARVWIHLFRRNTMQAYYLAEHIAWKQLWKNAHRTTPQYYSHTYTHTHTHTLKNLWIAVIYSVRTNQCAYRKISICFANATKRIRIAKPHRLSIKLCSVSSNIPSVGPSVWKLLNI